MLTQNLFDQKKELESKLKIDYVPRLGFSKASEMLETPLIKVVMGPRRSGKSIFCLELLKNKNFAYANFDEKELSEAPHEEILKSLEEIYPKAKYFLFDEIQNLHAWEFLANTMQRRGHNLLLTGSNAHLLSGDLATHLTGRYTEFTILPFSFTEYLQAKKEGSLYDYLSSGGFPEVVIFGLEAKNYLETLVKATVFNDVVKRYSLRFSGQVDEMSRYLGTNFAGEVNLNKLQKALRFRSFHTAQNYLGYLRQSFLFFFLSRFNFKYKEQLRFPKKVYLVDNGLVSALAFTFSQNLGKLMENAVFVELFRRGFRPDLELFYYKTRNGKEVDFVLKKGLEISEMIQVCADFSDLQTQKREVSALLEAEEELKCQNKKIIVWEKPKETRDLKDKTSFFQEIKIVTMEEFLNERG